VPGWSRRSSSGRERIEPAARAVRENGLLGRCRALGLEKPESFADQMLHRWHNGRMVLHPADPTFADQ